MQPSSLPLFDVRCGEEKDLPIKNFTFHHLLELHRLLNENVRILDPDFANNKSVEEMNVWLGLSRNIAQIQHGLYHAIANNPEAIVVWENSYQDDMDMSNWSQRELDTAIKLLRSIFPNGLPNEFTALSDWQKHNLAYWGAETLMLAFPVKNQFYRGVPNSTFWDKLIAKYPKGGRDYLQTRDHQTIACSMRAATHNNRHNISVFHVGGASHNFTPYENHYPHIQFARYPLADNSVYEKANQQYQMLKTKFDQKSSLPSTKQVSFINNAAIAGWTLLLASVIAAALYYLFDKCRQRHRAKTRQASHESHGLAPGS